MQKAKEDESVTELPILMKADVQGSVEPIVNSLERLGTEELRVKRADFVNRFVAPRKFYMIRATNPQALMDEVDKVL